MGPGFRRECDNWNGQQLDGCPRRKILRPSSVLEPHMSDAFHELFPLGEDTAPYRKLTGDYISPASFDGERVVKVAPQALTLLARMERGVDAGSNSPGLATSPAVGGGVDLCFPRTWARSARRW